MFWVDRVAKEIVKSGRHKPYWVDDMKTPSGRIHVGSLRGVVLHDLIYKALLDLGVKAKFTYLFDDHDPMDALPACLPLSKWKKYLGQPLYTIPSPKKGFKNFAQHYALEFQEVFNKIGSHPKIIWVSKLYKKGKMNEVVRECLNKVEVVRGIYEELYKRKMPKNWYPFQVNCPSCGKISTTTVTNWDGREVGFECQINKVNWTKGCGLKDKISPLSGNGKLLWKVEWAAKWKVIGVTVEGAGKDHMTAGGSHDVARLVCERVLNYPVPYPFSYEFFLVAGRKMSSSKGLGTSAKEIAEILPSELLRFIMVRSKINQTIDFDPWEMTIPDLFDEYDKCAEAFFNKSNKYLARIFELSQVGKKAKKPTMRFRMVANYLQMPNVDLKKLGVAKERIHYARLWLEKYAPKKIKFEVLKKTPPEAKFTSKQKEYLGSLSNLLTKEWKRAEAFQEQLYKLAKRLGLPSQKAFEAIYLALIGKTYGPKAAWFILSLERDLVIGRFQKISQ